MSNVICFPAARIGPRGCWWYGGRAFKTAEELRASLSPLELKLLDTWAYYREGPKRVVVPLQSRDGAA